MVEKLKAALPLILQLVPFLALIIAFVAVFVGPLLTWFVAKRQIAASLAVANKQVLAPMRQAWINSLRDCLAELSSAATHYYRYVKEDPNGLEYQKLHFLSQRVELMVNTGETDHQKLLEVITTMLAMLRSGPQGRDEFIDAHKELLPLSRKILKCEWDRVKEPIKEPVENEALRA